MRPMAVVSNEDTVISTGQVELTHVEAGDTDRRHAQPTLHETTLRRVRSQSWAHVASVLVCGAPLVAVAWVAAALQRGDEYRWLSWLVAVLASIAVAAHLTLAWWQLRASDPERLRVLLTNQPPVYIPVDTTRPPLLQAIDVLTRLRSHYLTDGSAVAATPSLSPSPRGLSCWDPLTSLPRCPSDNLCADLCAKLVSPARHPRTHLALTSRYCCTARSRVSLSRGCISYGDARLGSARRGC